MRATRGGILSHFSPVPRATRNVSFDGETLRLLRVQLLIVWITAGFPIIKLNYFYHFFLAWLKFRPLKASAMAALQETARQNEIAAIRGACKGEAFVVGFDTATHEGEAHAFAIRLNGPADDSRHISHLAVAINHSDDPLDAIWHAKQLQMIFKDRLGCEYRPF